MSHEHEANAALLDAAFDTMEEVHLVHDLRDSGEMMQEHVLEHEGQLVGYAGLSAMVAPLGWLCLAPVAVAPAYQGKGYGHKLVARVGEVANTLGPEVIVLGKPSFYAASGFSSERAANLTSPYPLEYTLLAGTGDASPDDELIYPKAFSKLT
jgi:putative acetyltransferase